MTTLSAASALDGASKRQISERAFASASDRHPPVSPSIALAAASPRGKVLLIVRDALLALDLQRKLRESGYRVVGPAATLPDIQRLIDRGGVDAAILDLDVDRRTPVPVADMLAWEDVPFVFLAPDRRALPVQHRNRPVVSKPYLRASLLSALEAAKGGRSTANDDNRAWMSTVVPSARVYPPI